METLYPLQSLKHIDMINNSLVCNCQLEFVRRWCENQFVSAIATCHEKGDSDEKLWTNISPSKKCEIYGMSDYETMDVMLVIIGVSVTLFVMFVGLALSFCWGRASMKPIEKINFRNKYSRFMP
ncbi:hypothetical protein C0J52_12113 [Blattella germanica]|nr:hypothetical protein C0J52_12113 [Blattella germanica]